MVVDKMINTPHAHLILVSVIPSPVSNDEDKYLFKKVDLEMKKYANGARHFSTLKYLLVSVKNAFGTAAV